MKPRGRFLDPFLLTLSIVLVNFGWKKLVDTRERGGEHSTGCYDQLVPMNHESHVNMQSTYKYMLARRHQPTPNALFQSLFYFRVSYTFTVNQAMSGGPLHAWNKWAIQILVLLSFGLQILLFILASTRRHRSSTRLQIFLRLILWLAYLMADSTAVYTLGHLSMSGWLPEHQLVAFWAPFLLLHLGSQDNITAYALEDNQLWPRHLLTLGVQTVGVCYVLYKHMTHEPAMVVAASLMFIVGFLKYLERTWALKRATLDNIRSSIKAQPSRDVPVGSKDSTRDIDEEELLLFAHHVLPTCMAALTDYSEDSGKVSENWRGQHIGKVVELELSLMYDILYTKATMIHHWYGYFLRVISPLATIVAFLLFHFYGKQGQSKIDVIITYILFGGALLLDMVSLVKAAFSTWTCDLLDNKGGWGATLCKRLQSSRRLVKAAACRPICSRGWSGSIGQYNLFDVCCRDMAKRSIRVLKKIKLDDWWKRYQYKGTLVIQSDVKKLLFQRIWQLILKNDDLSGMFNVKSAHGKNIELQEVVFIWHMATNIFLSYLQGAKVEPQCVNTIKAIKALSNYMMFLAVARHDMLPALKLRSMCEKTSNDLEEIWSAAGPEGRKAGFVGILDGLTFMKKTGPFFLYDKRDYGTVFARQLERAIGGQTLRARIAMDHESRRMFGHILPNFGGHETPVGVEKVLDLVLDGWVRMLVAASIKSSRESHAKQLSHGGELITIAWIMTEHFQRRVPR
ncbi:hypothetical protein VPH35_114273 [Triticum aestivum]